MMRLFRRNTKTPSPAASERSADGKEESPDSAVSFAKPKEQPEPKSGTRKHSPDSSEKSFAEPKRGKPLRKHLNGLKLRTGSAHRKPSSSSSSSYSDSHTFVSVESNDFNERTAQANQEQNTNSLTIAPNTNAAHKGDQAARAKPSGVERIENLENFDRVKPNHQAEERKPNPKKNVQPKFASPKRRYNRTGHTSPPYGQLYGAYPNYQGYAGYPYAGEYKESDYSTPVHQLDPHYLNEYFHSPSSKKGERAAADGFYLAFPGYEAADVHSLHYLNHYSGADYDELHSYMFAQKDGFDLKDAHAEPKPYAAAYSQPPTHRVKARQSSALQILNPETGEVVNSTKPTPSAPTQEQSKQESKLESRQQSRAASDTEEREDRPREEDTISPTTIIKFSQMLQMQHHRMMNGFHPPPKQLNGRARPRVRNVPINPAEVILTLTDLHPHRECMVHARDHSKSQLRKIANVPVPSASGSTSTLSEAAHPDEPPTEPAPSAPREEPAPAERPVEPERPRPEPPGPRPAELEPDADTPGRSFPVRKLLMIAKAMKIRRTEELGHFKLVPLNYTISVRRKKKDTKWRSEVSIEKEEITTSKLRKTNLTREEQYRRSIRTLLNKLTVEKFLVVSEKIAALYQDARCQEDVDALVDLVHEKATSELEYTDMYADLAFLLKYTFNDRLDLGFKTSCFHRTLLNKCQDAFEEISTNYALNKEYILGNIRFMGELFLRKILSITILKRISNTLLTSNGAPEGAAEPGEGGVAGGDPAAAAPEQPDSGAEEDNAELSGSEAPSVPASHEFELSSDDADPDAGPPKSSPSESDDASVQLAADGAGAPAHVPPANLIECFSELLTTIGYTVERIPGGHALLDEYLAVLVNLKNTKVYQTRINFKIQDLIDLRKRNWKKKLFKEKATSVSQIHKQAEQEQLKGSALGQEANYITAGLQINRHYSDYLFNKRHQVLELLANGVYTGAKAPAG